MTTHTTTEPQDSGLAPSRRAVPAGLTVALRAVLQHPLLQDTDEHFPLAWPWRRELQAFFAEHAGWTLQFGPGVLRLNAHAPFAEGGRGLTLLKYPQDASLLAWTMWYHESLGILVGETRQCSTEELAEAISGPSGTDFSVFRHRQSLKRAVRQLVDLGGVRIIDAGSGAWEDGQGEAGWELLEFTPGMAYLIAPTPPEQHVPPALRAARALLVGPALSRGRDEQAFLALDTELQRTLEDTLDWVLDVQGDHAALMMDTQSRKGAQLMTLGRSSSSAAALLLAEALRQELTDPGDSPPLRQDQHGRVMITAGRLYTLMDRVREAFRGHWGKNYALHDTGKVLADVLDHWQELGGLSPWDETPGGQIIEPHLARARSGYGAEQGSAGRTPRKKPASQRQLTDLP